MRRLILVYLLLSFSVVIVYFMTYSMPINTVSAQPAPPRPTLSAPPRPPLPPTPTPVSTDYISPSLICLQLANHMDIAASNPLLLYDLKLLNRSSGDKLRNATIRLPLPALDHMSVAVKTSSDLLWVSSVTTNSLSLRVSHLRAGEYLTATIQLQPVLNTDTPEMVTRASVEWLTEGGIIAILSNSVTVMNGRHEIDIFGSHLQLMQNQPPQSPILIGSGYTSLERVGVWALLRNGDNVAITDIFADSEGRFTLPLDTSRLPAHIITFVAQGACSEVIGLINLSE